MKILLISFSLICLALLCMNAKAPLLKTYFKGQKVYSVEFEGADKAIIKSYDHPDKFILCERQGKGRWAVKYPDSVAYEAIIAIDSTMYTVRSKTLSDFNHKEYILKQPVFFHPAMKEVLADYADTYASRPFRVLAIVEGITKLNGQSYSDPGVSANSKTKACIKRTLDGAMQRVLDAAKADCSSRLKEGTTTSAWRNGCGFMSTITYRCIGSD